MTIKIKPGDLVAEYIDDWYLIVITSIRGNNAFGIVLDNTYFDNGGDEYEETIDWNDDYPHTINTKYGDYLVKLGSCIMIEKNYIELED